MKSPLSKNIRYQDICTDKFIVNIAFNNEPGAFEILNNFMVKYQVNPVKGEFSYIPRTTEILVIFFKNNNILVNWINCNFTWGWYDFETGKWTGAVGQVI